MVMDERQKLIQEIRGVLPKVKAKGQERLHPISTELWDRVNRFRFTVEELRWCLKQAHDLAARHEERLALKRIKAEQA